VTESQATRHNPYTGMDCPPWCTVDHTKAGEIIGRACIGGGTGIGSIWARAFLGPYHGGNPVAVVTGAGNEPGQTYHVELRPHLAPHLAGLVELLADATPDQHRQLAAEIRHAAAQAAACPDHRPVLDSEAGWYCAACGSDAPPAGQGGQP
jgi:hypothetical protein